MPDEHSTITSRSTTATPSAWTSRRLTTSSRSTVTGRGGESHVLAGTHLGVRADSVDLDRRDCRWHLHQFAAKRRKSGFDLIISYLARPGG